MGHEERKIDKKVLDGVWDRDGGREAGTEEARVGRREEERSNDETRHSHHRRPA